MTRVVRRNKVGVGNTLTIVGEITPPVLSVDVDNYNPTGFGPGVMIRQDVSVNNVEISGFPAPAFPDIGMFGIQNTNAASLDLRFKNNVNSDPANRILLRDNAQKSLKPNDTGWFQYDHSKQRWTPANRIG